MRHPARVIQGILRYLVLVLALGFAARAHADDRSEARAHYQAGVKFYASGDYQGAIREFSAAQQLVPADLNNYNLALCYDKLGDAEPAIQYYRAFLDKQPGTDKRAEIQASVDRLEAAVRSASSKKADAKRTEDAKKAEDARRAAEDAKRAEDAKKAEDAKRATQSDEVAGPPPPPAAAPSGPVLGPAPAPNVGAAPGPDTGPVLGPSPPPSSAPPAREGKRRGPATAAPATAGSIGTPSSGSAVPTGDTQLDRANTINIDEIRDRRVGAVPPAGPGAPSGRDGRDGSLGPNGSPGPSGSFDRPSGPAVAAAEPPSGQPQDGAPPLGPDGQSGTPDVPRKEDPVYKKWWFWAVVAVGGYVAYQLVQGSSGSTNTGRVVPPTQATVPPPGGLPLLRW